MYICSPKTKTCKTLSSNGILPDPAKISALNNIKEPSNITEVKPFLGRINYCNHFITNFSNITAPTRQFTKKNTSFE